MSLLLFSGLLLGCGAPAGSWTGLIDCGDGDSSGEISVVMDLRKEEPTVYAGPAEVDFEGVFRIQGADRAYREELDFDRLELRLTAESGAQEASLSGEAVSCATWVDGEPADEGCDGGDALDWAVSWDGADLLEFDEGDCAGSLQRG